ncbi:MAG: hypothetical protein WBV21_10670, partial [Desulfobacterales bacterium]
GHLVYVWSILNKGVRLFLTTPGLAQTNKGQGIRMSPDRFIIIIVSAIVVSGLIIAGFYLFED